MDDIKPRRELNLLQTSAIIIGAVIGSGVFINLPIVAKYAGTPLLSVLIWFIGGILWLPQILLLAEMGTAYPDQGGPYYFLYKAGSPFLAFLYTWTAFLTSDTPTLTIIGLTAASVLKYFSPLFGDPVYAKIFASILIFALAYVQFRSVKTGGNIQIVLTVAKVLPLLMIIIIGLFFLNAGNLFPQVVFSQNNAGKSTFYLLTAGISSTLWAYAGFLNILYMAGEVKDPSRVLPKSLLRSMLFVIAAYTLISFCTSAIVPFDQLTGAAGEFINPFGYLSFFSSYAGSFFAIVAFISMIGVLNSVIMTQPRLEYAIARDGLFFKVFGHLHPKYLTPDYSIFIQAGMAVLLFLLGNIENLLGYFTLSYVLQNALVYGAVFYLRRKEDYKPSYKVRFWRSMAVLSVAIQLYLAYGTFIAFPAAGVLASMGLISSGLPVYFYYRKRRRKSETMHE
ncbi:MAG: amino acid permease [Methanococcaceae archaeon]